MIMKPEEDNKFMQRCLDLASKAQGATYPNPLVGAVIVHDGSIIGEGFHLKAGSAHAEVIAVNSVADSRLLKSSTLYVNLEPCSHHGKTPPCSDLIISSGIKKVVIGTKDTSDKVSGRGISNLVNAGCNVITEVLGKESRWINRRFFTFHEKKRPYIILKWAQSADGFLDYVRDYNTGVKPVWISGEVERVLVHRWRAEEQSILAGAGTLRADNPLLNVREWPGVDPIRIILSSSGSVDERSALFRIPGKNILFTHNNGNEIINTVRVKIDNNRSSASQMAEYLFNLGLQSVMVEGGAKVLDHFITTGLWDEARIFYGKAHFNEGIPAPTLNGKIHKEGIFSRSILKVIVNEVD
jgi:diaminohydroxyphosphoribosylaminopyrimidine deaminase/5-amino-6-(5-phosphoribosylamino)uracil reductase